MKWLPKQLHVVVHRALSLGTCIGLRTGQFECSLIEVHTATSEKFETSSNRGCPVCLSWLPCFGVKVMRLPCIFLSGGDTGGTCSFDMNCDMWDTESALWSHCFLSSCCTGVVGNQEAGRTKNFTTREKVFSRTQREFVADLTTRKCLSMPFLHR